MKVLCCSLNLCDYPSIDPPNVRVTVATPRSIEVTWDPSLQLAVATGYLISYTTTAPYTSGGIVTVNDSNATNGTLTNLEENTSYNISVQAVVSNELRVSSSEVSIMTWTDGKL